MSQIHGRPIQGLSGAEAADILGIDERSVARLVTSGVLHKPGKWVHRGLDRDEVERLALQRWKRGHSNFASTTEATQLLGVSKTSVVKMVTTGRLPFVEHNGRRFYRRHQLEVIANARESRALGHRHGG